MKLMQMMPTTKAFIQHAIDADDTVTKDERRLIERAIGTSPKRILITTKQACEILDVTPRTLSRYHKTGLIKPAVYRNGRYIRWDKDEIEEFKYSGIAA